MRMNNDVLHLLAHDVVNCGEDFNGLGAHVQKEKRFCYICYIIIIEFPTYVSYQKVYRALNVYSDQLVCNIWLGIRAYAMYVCEIVNVDGAFGLSERPSICFNQSALRLSDRSTCNRERKTNQLQDSDEHSCIHVTRYIPDCLCWMPFIQLPS